MIYDLTIREEDRQQIIAGLSLSLAGSTVGKPMKQKVYTSYLHRHILFGFIDTQKLYQLALQIELAPDFSFLRDELEQYNSMHLGLTRMYANLHGSLDFGGSHIHDPAVFQQTQLEMEIIGRTLPLPLKHYDASKIYRGKENNICQKDYDPCVRVIPLPKGSENEPATELLYSLTVAQGLIPPTLVYEI